MSTTTVNIRFYIIKENHLGEEYKHYVTPEPAELKVGLSNAKYLKSGMVSMFKPLRDCTLYYETF